MIRTMSAVLCPAKIVPFLNDPTTLISSANIVFLVYNHRFFTIISLE